MRKVTFGCANSLDNFIAREDGSYDWLLHGEEANEVMREFWPKIDTMVMGRKTYDIAQQFAPKPKKKKAKHPVTFRESAARAFEHVLRTAARNNGLIAITVEGKNIFIDAKKLKEILSHQQNGHSIESEILRFATPKA